MTRAQFEFMEFEDLMEWAVAELNEVTEEDTLIAYAKDSLEKDDLGIVIHILTAIYENPWSTTYYRYDYTAGTFDTPTPICDKEDIMDLIDLEGENEK